jgi:hypothetical protein
VLLENIEKNLNLLMKILQIRCPSMAAWLAFVVLFPCVVKSEDTMVVFGLTNVALNGATLVPRETYPGVRVENLDDQGLQGVSVLLGQADSGLFFSPQLDGQPGDGNSMQASVFGKAGAHEGLLGTVFCKKDSWGSYPLTVDFTGIGSSNFTVQVFCYDTLAREETNSSGSVTFHTESAGNLYPRANPCWRAPDGSIGVLIDFGFSLVTLERGQAYGNRVFIKPQQPAATVEYVSRVDIYGGGGLTYFESWGEWLGMYSLPHLALGSAVMSANHGALSVSGLGESGQDGVTVELGGAGSYEMSLQPIALPTNATLRISANGFGDSYYFLGRNFLGPVYLWNTNSATQVAGIFGDVDTNRVRITILNDGALIGSMNAESGAWGSISNSSWKIAGLGVRPALGTKPSALYIKFDGHVSFLPAGGGMPLEGNQMLFSWFESGPEPDSFANFQVQASGLPSLSITNAITTAATPERLSIARSGGDIHVSWPYRPSSSFLQSTPDLNSPFTSTNLPPYELTGSQWQFTVPAARAPQEFFRLWDWCLSYNQDLGGSE